MIFLNHQTKTLNPKFMLKLTQIDTYFRALATVTLRRNSRVIAPSVSILHTHTKDTRRHFKENLDHRFSYMHKSHENAKIKTDRIVSLARLFRKGENQAREH